MKTGLKYLGIVALAIVAVTWPLVNVSSTEEEERGSTEDLAAREAFRRLQLQDENGQIPPDGLVDALKQKEAMLFLPEAWGEFLQGTDPPAWVSIGPGNIGGRIRSIVINPDNPATMWLGAVAGGVWKTTDAGRSWSTNTDLLANLAVNCMVIDPANSSILYAGTGEGFFNNDAVRGNGIFKTTDGGNTWVQLPSTIPTPGNQDFYWVNRLAISPTNSQLLLAATRSNKILRSTDGGGTWSTRLTAPDPLLDVVFRPNNETVPAITCLAGSFRGEVYYSTNDGLDWTMAPDNGLPGGGDYQRVELAYSRSNPSIVYALAAADGQLYQSTNGGFRFVAMGTPPGEFGVDWYKNTLWVDPTNSNTVLVGGSNLWRTTGGGVEGSWTKVNSFHPDHHVIIEDPGYNAGTNQTVYEGNDGGIYKTTNVLAAPPMAVNWANRNNNLAITQFYGGAGNVATGKIIGGTQDNGTVRYRNDPQNPDWTTPVFGDGGFCAADQTDSNYFYGEAPFLQIYRSTDGGGSAYGIWRGPNDVIGIPADCSNRSTPCANFIAPFILDPNNEKTMLAGGRSLWRSTDVKDPQPSWAEIKSPVVVSGDYVNISAVAVAQGNSDFIWIGYNNGSVYYTANGTAASPTWFQVGQGVLPGRMCTRITIGPAPQTDAPRARKVYATFSGFYSDNVWKTENSGGTWTNSSTFLPEAPIYSLVISPSNSDRLYIGTEVGIFASANGGMTWSPGEPGVGQPADVRVDELFWMGNKLVAATHGRGMFTIGQ